MCELVMLLLSPVSSRVYEIIWNMSLACYGHSVCLSHSQHPNTSLPSSLPAGQHATISFTQWSKNGFLTPQGRHVAVINVNHGMGVQTHFPVPNFTFIDEEMWDYSSKAINLEFFP